VQRSALGTGSNQHNQTALKQTKFLHVMIGDVSMSPIAHFAFACGRGSLLIERGSPSRDLCQTPQTSRTATQMFIDLLKTYLFNRRHERSCFKRFQPVVLLKDYRLKQTGRDGGLATSRRGSTYLLWNEALSSTLTCVKFHVVKFACVSVETHFHAIDELCWSVCIMGEAVFAPLDRV
jgi:hypothetical protein